MNDTSTFSANDYVPMSAWGKDHHSTVAYAETVMVECGGFQVGLDSRMRSSRRNFRVMSLECPRPKRPGRPDGHLAVAMSTEHGTRLNNGQTLQGHDDWACLQDAAREGLFTAGPEDIEPGVTLHLSDRGRQYCAELRAHKASGGNFATFVFSAQTPVQAAAAST
jgi:hypothetical protein